MDLQNSFDDQASAPLLHRSSSQTKKISNEHGQLINQSPHQLYQSTSLSPEPVSLSNNQHYQVYSSRFLMLFTYGLLSFNQALFWLTFSPISDKTQKYYKVTPSTVNLLLNWGPIAFIPMQFVVFWLSATPKGVQKTVYLTAFLTLIATAIRLIPNWLWDPVDQSNNQSTNQSINETNKQLFETYAIYFLHVGQFLNALAGPLVMSSVSQLSSLWFPPNERARATSFAVFANCLGPGFGFLQMSRQISRPDEIPNILYTHLGMAIFGSVLAFATFEAYPVTPPSHAASLIIHQLINQTNKLSIYQSINQSFHSVKSSFMICLQNPSFLCIALIGGGVTGIFACWAAMFESILTPVLCPSIGQSINQSINQSDCDSNEITRVAGWIGFSSTLASVVGGISMGALADTPRFRRKWKMLMYVSSIIATLIFAYFLDITDSPLFQIFHQSINQSTQGSVLGLAVTITVFGFAVEGLSPLCYELGAEITYPISEHYSAGIIALFCNFFALVFIYVQPFVTSGTMNMIVFVTLLAAICTIVPIRERYTRRDQDDIRKQQSINQSDFKSVDQSIDVEEHVMSPRKYA